jgi:antirestriction protein ArdC
MTTSLANTVRHNSRTSAEPARDPMQEFANRIIAELENGVKPWVRPWDPEKAGGPQAPFNPVTGKRYHGINVLILGMDMRAFQSGDPRWMAYQQAQEGSGRSRRANARRPSSSPSPMKSKMKTKTTVGKQFVF